MPSTPAFGFRFPAPGETPDVPRDIRNLAEDVEGQVQITDAAVAAVSEDFAASEALGPKVLGTFEGGAGTNVTTFFNNIDQSYTHLQLIWRGTHDGTNNAVSLGMRFNSDDTDGNYASFRGYAIPNAASWTVQDVQTATAIHAGLVGGHFGSHGVLWIPLYSNVSGVHVIHGTCFARGVDGASTGILWGEGGGTWTPSSNAAITSIQVWPVGQNWDGDAVATLVGYK